MIRLADEVRNRFELEAELAQRCPSAGVPVPRIVFVGRIGSSGTAVSAQEIASGEVLSSFLDRVDQDTAAEAVRNAGEILARIHSVSTSGFGPLAANLTGIESHLADWFVDGMRPQMSAALSIAPEARPLLERTMALIERHRWLLDDCAPGLLHGDFSPANVFVDERGTVTAVIDWEASKSGPPELDIGWWDCFFESPSSQAGWLLAGYQRAAALDPERLAVLRRLTVLRILVGHYSWSMSVHDAKGVDMASRRLEHELKD